MKKKALSLFLTVIFIISLAPTGGILQVSGSTPNITAGSLGAQLAAHDDGVTTYYHQLDQINNLSGSFQTFNANISGLSFTATNFVMQLFYGERSYSVGDKINVDFTYIVNGGAEVPLSRSLDFVEKTEDWQEHDFFWENIVIDLSSYINAGNVAVQVKIDNISFVPVGSGGTDPVVPDLKLSSAALLTQQAGV
ncbi:MAG: hypothetical protein FWD48_11755 [Oscillospiraceae bacterium]|nr:hypothetical protein [Oscillospiraceae bacterium]